MKEDVVDSTVQSSGCSVQSSGTPCKVGDGYLSEAGLSHFWNSREIKDSMKRKLRAVIVVGIVLLVCSNCASNSESGSVSVTFSFDNAPQQVVWVWAKVIVQEKDANSGSSLASDGPYEYEPGGTLSVKLDGIPHGENRQVILEVRDGPISNLPVVFYGISSTFSIMAGDSKEVDVSVALKNPDGEGAIKLLFQNEERAAIGLAEIENSTVLIEAKGASSVLLSNSLSFAMFDSVRIEGGREEILCTQETVEGETWTMCQYIGWNLLSGLFSTPEDAVDGRYYVYAKFIDENGYESGIASASVTLDTKPPQVMSTLLIKYEEEGMEHATVLLTADESIDVEPKNSQMTVAPDGENAPGFIGPLRVGLSTSYQWHSETESDDDDKSTYLFSVKLMDELGNQTDWIDLEDDKGEPLTYQKGCDCTQGPCCDGCYYLPDSTICEHSGEMEYGCPMGTGCGDDVWGRSMSIYCSGQSAGCDGDKQDWLMAEQCDEAEVCSEDAGVCVGKEQCSCSTPTVYSVIPAQAQLNHETLFTVTGCKLPLSAAAWIGNCMDVQYLSHTSEQFTFSCWPTSSTGPQEGHIRTEAGGVLLKQFFVDFYQ